MPTLGNVGYSFTGEEVVHTAAWLPFGELIAEKEWRNLKWGLKAGA